ncbi:sensor histidine kinase [Agaribacterium sp. ZY112]|uniref:sensor histidine kinase n=1 Tax=Agaribacterium sp. ZY112 TaxID=3233574 RepID=UPI003524332C
MISKTYRFFVFQLIGWLLFALIHAAGHIISVGFTPYLVWELLIKTSLGLVITTFLSRFFQRISLRPLWQQAVAGLVACYIAALAFIFSKNLIAEYLYWSTWATQPLLAYTQHMLWAFLIMLCWSFIYFSAYLYQQLQDQKNKALELTNIAHQAQLKMLRYQLNPHFLFNTLNAISTLILLKRNENANDMTQKLSDFLRLSLDSDPIQLVALRQELHALRLYLDIEQVRFSDRLKVVWAVDESCLEALVPSLILQPLVENSIKHAIALSETGGTLRISATTDLSTLCLIVADDGPGAEVEEGMLKNNKGVGVLNVRDRLAALYSDKYEFSMSSDSGLSTRIRIPLELQT